jgi:hypothetical protein
MRYKEDIMFISFTKSNYCKGYPANPAGKEPDAFIQVY